MKYAALGHKDGSWLSIIDVNEELSHGKHCANLLSVCVCVSVWVCVEGGTDLWAEFKVARGKVISCTITQEASEDLQGIQEQNQDHVILRVVSLLRAKR